MVILSATSGLEIDHDYILCTFAAFLLIFQGLICN